MEHLEFDSGDVTFTVNGRGELRFNPADPALYARFQEAEAKLPAIARALQDREGEDTLSLLWAADREGKALLSSVFPGCDMEAVFGGCNLFALGANGKYAVENFFDALLPVLTEGARRCAKQLCEDAGKKADARREKIC